MIQRPNVELIIPTYNRLDILQNTVLQVRTLYPDLPICLGIQGEIPDSILRVMLDRDPHLRCERLPSPGTTRTLNHCIISSQADIALIIDDDAVPCSGWLESHMQALSSDPGLAYTCGREIRVRNGRSTYADVPRVLVESFFRPFLPKDVAIHGRIIGWTSATGLIFGNYDQVGTCRINTPRGCNMAVRKSALMAIGGFNGSFRGNAWGFEADFGLRIAQGGGYGRYLGSAAVLHYEVPAGGSRQGGKWLWYRDYLYNHKLLITHLGPQAWIGAVPRLLKRAIWLMTGRRTDRSSPEKNNL